MLCNHGILWVMLFITGGISVACVGERINYSSLVPACSHLPTLSSHCPDLESQIHINKHSKYTLLAPAPGEGWTEPWGERSRGWFGEPTNGQRGLAKPLNVSGPRFALPKTGITKRPRLWSELVIRSKRWNSGSSEMLHTSAVKFLTLVLCVWNSLCRFFWSVSVARLLWKPNQTKELEPEW